MPMQDTLMKFVLAGGMIAVVLMLALPLRAQLHGLHCFVRRLSNFERTLLLGFLAVFVAYGGTKPPPERYTVDIDGERSDHVRGDVVSASTFASVTNGYTNVVCVGWVGTGDVPTVGASNAVTFKVTQDSSLRWRYATNYWVSATACVADGALVERALPVCEGGNVMLKDAAGMVLPTNELWAAAGTNLATEATANEGYVFARWIDAETGAECGALGERALPVERPWIVRAEFTNLAFVVRFELGEHGTRTGGGELEQTVAWGDAAVEPTVAAADGYAFSGWSAAFDRVVSNIVVTAQYAAGGYAITYEDTRGCHNDNPLAYTVEDAVTFSALTNPPGWKFVGWEPAEIVRGSTGDTNVVAQWEQLIPVAYVGQYASFDLEENLGVEIPADGDKVTVKVEGLAKGLKLAQNGQTGNWILSGVPTEAIDFEKNPMYVRVTVTYKNKTMGDKGKAETLQPLMLSVVSPVERSFNSAGDLNEVYGPVDIRELWPEVAKEMTNPNEWSFKGWPAGIKYNAKAADVSWSYKDGKTTVKTNAGPYMVYGQPTKAGEFTVTATHKHKPDGSKTTVSETFSATLTVWGNDGAEDFRTVDQAYVPTTAAPLTDVKSVSGLPAGIKFDKATGELYGTPTKPGVFAVTVTKTDKSKETFLWKVEPGENDGILDEIGWDAEYGAVTVMQGVVQDWAVSMPEGAKVTASGLPAGLKLAQDKTAKTWTLAGTPTKAGNFVVTLKTVLNGVTVTERIAIKVTANEWAGKWYGVQAGGDADASCLAEATVSANGTVKLVYTEASTNYSNKGVVQSAVRKTTVTVKNLDANGTTATLTLPKDKRDELSVARKCVLDFANSTLTVGDEPQMYLGEVDTSWVTHGVPTIEMKEVLDGETNDYGYVSATYKSGKFTFSGKLWDGTKVKGTAYPLAGGSLSPVLLTDKAKNAVSITLIFGETGDVSVVVRENGKLLQICPVWAEKPAFVSF